MSVLAEGIETEAQSEILRAMGCDVGQRYLFARPARGIRARKRAVRGAAQSGA